MRGVGVCKVKPGLTRDTHALFNGTALGDQRLFVREVMAEAGRLVLSGDGEGARNSAVRVVAVDKRRGALLALLAANLLVLLQTQRRLPRDAPAVPQDGGVAALDAGVVRRERDAVVQRLVDWQ